MPAADRDLVERSASPEIPTQLPFPPVTRSHILNCSYHSWYPRYRALTPKARLIALSTPFLFYLRADGILLPPEGISSIGNFDDADQVEQDEEEDSDPSLLWPNIHAQIKSTIAELGGSVVPKLNWSAPKDATWISATNSMVCNTPNDIYLLLKSSDFITHDLEQIFDGCDDDVSSSIESRSEEEVDEGEDTATAKTKELENMPYHLVLRKAVPTYNPSLEFRCFVRSRQLLCICQRDLNHYNFLAPLIPKLRPLICSFFNHNLKRTFPDDSFVFDVYIPPPHGRVWLIDVNPWAPRTDPLLFSWLEILGMNGAGELGRGDLLANRNNLTSENGDLNGAPDEEDSDGEDAEAVFTPEFRLVRHDDPEAYRFNAPQYSAHKLPKDVVDASNDGEAGLREFMGTWREIVAQQENEARGESSGA